MPATILGSANLGTSVPRYSPVLAVLAAGPRDRQLRPWLLLLRAHYSALLNHLAWYAHAAWRSARSQLLRAPHCVARAARSECVATGDDARAVLSVCQTWKNLTVLNVKRTKGEIRFLLALRFPTRGYHYPEAAGLSSDRALLRQFRSGAAWGTLEINLGIVPDLVTKVRCCQAPTYSPCCQSPAISFPWCQVLLVSGDATRFPIVGASRRYNSFNFICTTRTGNSDWMESDAARVLTYRRLAANHIYNQTYFDICMSTIWSIINTSS